MGLVLTWEYEYIYVENMHWKKYSVLKYLQLIEIVCCERLLFLIHAL